ncbi:ABC transporter substrate-binding protein [Falsiroseomonas bella]|uniref:ABC transporter substrate-binding protein n=1 Tax=Falsiroseomonas bella TaxID=2184016 RepID=A0A317F8M7_9PROT|nr:tripartite tricarboxylate transporter substrate binding protein [Falsiroseomonas bella]PWS34377.1 ABC transporter substrate-binding protein [Falsiroseomonas bella]
MTTRLPRRHLLLGAATLPFVTRAASAQAAWAPARPLRLIVPFAPGGSTDVAARILGERMGETLGHPVVVENRAGAGGAIGTEAAARSAPDGHTLLLGTNGVMTIAPNLGLMRSVDIRRDLAPVSMAFKTDILVVVPATSPARTLADFIAMARARPGQVAFGSSGVGTATHIFTEVLAAAAGIELSHVPYRGSGQAMNDLMAGTIQLMLDQPASSIGGIRDGRLRALATTSATRNPLLPDVPTVAEAGLRGAESSSWGAIMLPAGTPEPAVARLNAAVRDAVAQPSVLQRLAAAGLDGTASSPAELAEFIRAETDRWGRVVRERNIRVEG